MGKAHLAPVAIIGQSRGVSVMSRGAWVDRAWRSLMAARREGKQTRSSRGLVELVGEDDSGAWRDSA